MFAARYGMGEHNAERHHPVRHPRNVRHRCDAISSVDEHVDERNPPPRVPMIIFVLFAALHQLRYLQTSVRLSYG